MAELKNALSPKPVNSLWRTFGQYLRDALPGGALNPEWTPSRVENAKTALSFTPVVGDVLSGYDAIQSARQGNYGEAALNAAGLLPFVPSLAGIFVGKGAKTWNKAMNDMAQELEKQGVSAEKIWETTGNFRSPDGNWRQEISDTAAKFRTNFDASIASKANDYKGGIEGPIGGMYTHPNLYQAYPELLRTDRMTVTKLPDWLPSSVESGMHSRTFSGKGKTDIRAKTETGALDSSIHELQHAVQNLEGFQPGGTESMFGLGEEAFQKYRLLAGEAEARAAAARRSLTDAERKSLFPLSSYDVPVNKLTYKK